MKPTEVIRITETTKFDQVMPHHRLVISPVASFAMDLMKSHIVQSQVPEYMMVADGDQKFRLMGEAEIVLRCISVAEHAFAIFEEKKWTTEVPQFDDLRRDDAGRAGFK